MTETRETWIVDQMEEQDVYRFVKENSLCSSYENDIFDISVTTRSSRARSDPQRNDVILKRWITLEQLKTSRRGFGGRIGIIPYCYEGEKLHYIINRSNRNRYSDFGGGFRKNEYPYNGLLREIREEIPCWYPYLSDLVEDVPLIYCEENMSAKSDQLRLNILVFLKVDKRHLSPFEPSKEVTDIYYMNQNEIDELYQTDLNQGLKMLRSLQLKNRLC
jgi:hypothetical protein